MDDLDKIASDIQDSVDAQVRREYGEVVAARWKDLSHYGPLPGHNGRAVNTGVCGDTVEMFLKIEDGKVARASFLTDGCVATAVCASLAAEAAEGCGLGEVMDISGEDILSAAGGLPADHEHCAHLAAQALHAALEDFLAKSKPAFDPSGKNR
ncbi:MAG: iron-sulfur cluster assembly scaffold protein [Deltaproteobacteria bacterium]|nr:iron-sulfur cluster assembly scaffold protein [Deltaproteobacteria bacterium]